VSNTLPNFCAVDSFEGNHENADNLVERACPICGNDDHRPITALGKFQFFTDSVDLPKRVTLRQVQCRHCLTLFQNPCFSEQGFSNLFAEAGMSYGSTALRPAEQLAWLQARGLLHPGTVILDVGCYDGRFLSQLPSELIRQGVDIDALAIMRGLARDPALELVHSAFDKFSLSRRPEVITMFHVLEHLPDPIAVLRRLHEVAADSVRLIIEVPILEGGQTNDINGFFSVQHITHFSRSSLLNTLQVAGWQVVEGAKMEGYNGYRVVATKTAPQPAFAGSTADVGALQEVLASWYQAQRQVEHKLCVLNENSQLVIWGAGLHTEFLYQCTSLFNAPQRRFVLVDSDPSKQNRSWRGIPIASPITLAEHHWQNSHLLVSSYGGQESIVQAATALGVPANRVMCLYDDVSVY